MELYSWFMPTEITCCVYEKLNRMHTICDDKIRKNTICWLLMCWKYILLSVRVYAVICRVSWTNNDCHKNYDTFVNRNDMNFAQFKEKFRELPFVSARSVVTAGAVIPWFPDHAEISSRQGNKATVYFSYDKPFNSRTPNHYFWIVKLHGWE